jgi:hypothetical protein
MKSAGISLLLLIFATIAAGQDLSQRFSLEISTGAEAGWWIYDKGSDNAAIENNLGYDVTHLALILPFDAGLQYEWKKLSLGAGISYRVLNDDIMRSQGFSITGGNQYTIAEERVPFFQYWVQGSYTLADRPNFRFAPVLRFGGFRLESIHPEKANFGAKYFLEGGLHHQIRIWKNLWWILRLKYTFMTIRPVGQTHFHENHRIYGIGANTGLRIYFF